MPPSGNNKTLSSSLSTSSSKRNGGPQRSTKLLYAALGAMLLFVAGITWQLSLYARESSAAASTNGRGTSGSVENRRSLLWRIRKMSLGGAEDGYVKEKARDLDARRKSSSSIHDLGVGDDDGIVAAEKEKKEKEKNKPIRNRVGNNNVVDSSVPPSSDVQRKSDASADKDDGDGGSGDDDSDDDSQRNAVDDAKGAANDGLDSNIVLGARKVKGSLLKPVAGEGDAEEIFITKYPKWYKKEKNEEGSAKNDAEIGGGGGDEGKAEDGGGNNEKQGGHGKKGGKKGKKKGGGKKGGKGAGGGGGKHHNEAAEQPDDAPPALIAGNRPERNDGEQEQEGDNKVVESPPTTTQSSEEQEALSRYMYHNISLRSSPTLPPVAYALIISNEVFLDGALVLGVSLRQRCPSLQKRTAAMTIIVPIGRLSDDSLRRLMQEGGFDEIVLVQSLAPRAPGAFWKDTFDKLYMFSLTHYRRVVFMDADMICMKSMDKLLDFNLKDSRHVAAIGDKAGFAGTGGHSYFQTGMMVIQPDAEVFKEVMEEFESGVPPRGQQYNRGMNGRDGVLLRNYFQQRFHPIDNKYSRNLNPRYRIPDSVISLHPRGKHKPWFDWSLPIKDPDLGKKEFGFPYLEWWELYEEYVHKKAPLYQYALRKRAALATDSSSSPPSFVEDPFFEERLLRYGGTFNSSAADVAKRGAAAEGDDKKPLLSPLPSISPLTHVWVMRYSSEEYIQLLSEEDQRLRSDLSLVLHHGEQGGNVRNDWTPEGKASNAAFIEKAKRVKDLSTFKMIVGQKGQSCDEVCEQQSAAPSSLSCIDQGFHYYPFQNCTVLKAMLGCEICELGVYWRPHPGGDYPAAGRPKKQNGEEKGGPLRCFYNLMRDDRGLPRCKSYNETTTRLCPCAHVEA